MGGVTDLVDRLAQQHPHIRQGGEVKMLALPKNLRGPLEALAYALNIPSSKLAGLLLREALAEADARAQQLDLYRDRSADDNTDR